MKKLSLNLSKLLSTFNKKPNLTGKKREAAQPPTSSTASVKQPPAAVVKQPVAAAAVPAGVEMLDAITRFLRQYLVCDEHHYTILALWIVHTWCFRHFPTAPYLHIRSADSQSAKTLCLKLLANLSYSPWLATGPGYRSIMDNLLTSDRRVIAGQPPAGQAHTVLLDDCHHTFASAERQPVLSLLNSGSQADCTYVDGLARYTAFGPKAFAGNGALPRSLAARCIPIRLRRKKPSDVTARFTPDAAASAARLAQSIASWIAANSAHFAKVAYQSPARVPVGLFARELDCAEPLLHIAERIGGQWPERARVAIAGVFRLADDSLAIELLSDIRVVFYLEEDPSYLATRDLLASLTKVEHRPWSAWKHSSASARHMAQLLRPFGVTASDLHRGSSTTFRGYLRETFLDPWERYLPPIPEDWSATRAQMKKEAAAASTTKIS